MYGYKINRTGLRKMMTSDPQLHRALFRAAQGGRAVMQSLTPVDTGELRSSARVEDLGVKPVASGEPRMTVAIVFHAPYAAIVQGRTGFVTGAIGGRWM